MAEPRYLVFHRRRIHRLLPPVVPVRVRLLAGLPLHGRQGCAQRAPSCRLTDVGAIRKPPTQPMVRRQATAITEPLMTSARRTNAARSASRPWTDFPLLTSIKHDLMKFRQTKSIWAVLRTARFIMHPLGQSPGSRIILSY